jgi:micrococcal nuclease
LRKIRFRRQPLQSGLRRKAWLKVPRRRARPRYAPWPPLAVLVGVAGALWFAAEGYPNVNAPTGTSVLKGYGPSVLEGGRSSVAPRSGASATSASGSSRPSGNGSFVLCAGMPQANCVIDGDTIRYGGVKIRLADIDAPEVFSPRCASEAARGERATRRLLELMNQGPFRMVAGGRDEDRYGRKLRTIERNGRSLGDVLIAEGLARPWDGARRSWCS